MAVKKGSTSGGKRPARRAEKRDRVSEQRAPTRPVSDTLKPPRKRPKRGK